MSFLARDGRPSAAVGRPRSRRLTLLVLALLQFLIAVDVTVVNIALPSIGTDFGADARQLTWVVTGYTVVGGGLLMVGGRIADLHGRRRTLLVGAAVFGLASLAAGLATSLEMLVLARFAQGAGEALAAPAAMSTLALLYPDPAARSRALGVWAAVASSGLVLGFLLSGLITQLLHWRWIFLVNLPLIAVVLVGVRVLVVPDGRRAARQPLDLPGALLLTAAPLLLIHGVIEWGEQRPDVLSAAGTTLAGVLCALAFPVVERRSPHPLVPLSFFRDRVRVVANLATALLSAALSTSFFLLTLFVQRDLGLSPIAAGLWFLPLAVTLILATVVVPGVLRRVGDARGAVLGIVATGLGCGWLAVSPSDSAAVAVLPGMVCVASGMGVALVALQNAALHSVTEDDAGIASGVQRCADQLGGAGGVALYVGIGFSSLPGGDTDPYAVAYGMAIVGLTVAAIGVPLLSRGGRTA
ncbi:MFS transporter [Streptomyces uncialis]|uniref:MFS transporter n=1 Tax=Streptomyces uncialis TaxID=1048205 RepID=UPI0009A0F294|nr:MFS transporter [Streptomyces uncialis]